MSPAISVVDAPPQSHQENRNLSSPNCMRRSPAKSKNKLKALPLGKANRTSSSSRRNSLSCNLRKSKGARSSRAEKDEREEDLLPNVSNPETSHSSSSSPSPPPLPTPLPCRPHFPSPSSHSPAPALPSTKANTKAKSKAKSTTFAEQRQKHSDAPPMGVGPRLPVPLPVPVPAVMPLAAMSKGSLPVPLGMRPNPPGALPVPRRDPLKLVRPVPVRHAQRHLALPPPLPLLPATSDSKPPLPPSAGATATAAAAASSTSPAIVAVSLCPPLSPTLARIFSHPSAQISAAPRGASSSTSSTSPSSSNSMSSHAPAQSSSGFSICSTSNGPPTSATSAAAAAAADPSDLRNIETTSGSYSGSSSRSAASTAATSLSSMMSLLPPLGGNGSGSGGQQQPINLLPSASPSVPNAGAPLLSDSLFFSACLPDSAMIDHSLFQTSSYHLTPNTSPSLKARGSGDKAHNNSISSSASSAACGTNNSNAKMELPGTPSFANRKFDSHDMSAPTSGSASSLLADPFQVAATNASGVPEIVDLNTSSFATLLPPLTIAEQSPSLPGVLPPPTFTQESQSILYAKSVAENSHKQSSVEGPRAGNPSSSSSHRSPSASDERSQFATTMQGFQIAHQTHGSSMSHGIIGAQHRASSGRGSVHTSPATSPLPVYHQHAPSSHSMHTFRSTSAHTAPSGQACQISDSEGTQAARADFQRAAAMAGSQGAAAAADYRRRSTSPVHDMNSFVCAADTSSCVSPTSSTASASLGRSGTGGDLSPHGSASATSPTKPRRTLGISEHVQAYMKDQKAKEDLKKCHDDAFAMMVQRLSECPPEYLQKLKSSCALASASRAQELEVLQAHQEYANLQEARNCLEMQANASASMINDQKARLMESYGSAPASAAAAIVAAAAASSAPRAGPSASVPSSFEMGCSDSMAAAHAAAMLRQSSSMNGADMSFPSQAQTVSAYPPHHAGFTHHHHHAAHNTSHQIVNLISDPQFSTHSYPPFGVTAGAPGTGFGGHGHMPPFGVGPGTASASAAAAAMSMLGGPVHSSVSQHVIEKNVLPRSMRRARKNPKKNGASGANKKPHANFDPVSNPELERMLVDALGDEIHQEKRTGRWREKEGHLMVYLHNRGYKARQIADILKRTYDSVGRKLRTETDPSYARYGQDTDPHRPIVPWAQRVMRALKQMPGQQGTAADIRRIIEAKYNDLNTQLKPGNKHRLRWHHSVDGALSSSPYVFKTGEKRGRSAVWRLSEHAVLRRCPGEADDPDFNDVDVEHDVATGTNHRRRQSPPSGAGTPTSAAAAAAGDADMVKSPKLKKEFEPKTEKTPTAAPAPAVQRERTEKRHLTLDDVSSESKARRRAGDFSPRSSLASCNGGSDNTPAPVLEVPPRAPSSASIASSMSSSSSGMSSASGGGSVAGGNDPMCCTEVLDEKMRSLTLPSTHNRVTCGPVPHGTHSPQSASSGSPVANHAHPRVVAAAAAHSRTVPTGALPRVASYPLTTASAIYNHHTQFNKLMPRRSSHAENDVNSMNGVCDLRGRGNGGRLSPPHTPHAARAPFATGAHMSVDAPRAQECFMSSSLESPHKRMRHSAATGVFM